MVEVAVVAVAIIEVVVIVVEVVIVVIVAIVVIIVVVVIVVVVAVVPRCFSLAWAVSGRWLSSSDAHNQFFWRKTKKRVTLLFNDEL